MCRSARAEENSVAGAEAATGRGTAPWSVPPAAIPQAAAAIVMTSASPAIVTVAVAETSPCLRLDADLNIACSSPAVRWLTADYRRLLDA